MEPGWRRSMPRAAHLQAVLGARWTRVVGDHQPGGLSRLMDGNSGDCVVPARHGGSCTRMAIAVPDTGAYEFVAEPGKDPIRRSRQDFQPRQTT